MPFSRFYSLTSGPNFLKSSTPRWRRDCRIDFSISFARRIGRPWDLIIGSNNALSCSYRRPQLVNMLDKDGFHHTLNFNTIYCLINFKHFMKLVQYCPCLYSLTYKEHNCVIMHLNFSKFIIFLDRNSNSKLFPDESLALHFNGHQLGRPQRPERLPRPHQHQRRANRCRNSWISRQGKI